MQRIESVELRLQNWARWVLAGRASERGYARANPAGFVSGGSGYVEAHVPIVEVEAGETDDAVNRLHPGGLRLAVHAFYLQPGTVADRAATLTCSERTLHRRVCEAHQQLADHFAVKRERLLRARDTYAAGAVAPLPLKRQFYR